MKTHSIKKPFHFNVTPLNSTTSFQPLQDVFSYVDELDVILLSVKMRHGPSFALLQLAPSA